MSEPRSGVEVRAEQVAAAREAVQRATAAAVAQQQAAGAWLDASAPAREVVDPERFEH